MTTIILSIICCILAAALITVTVKNRKIKKSAADLTESINDYFNEGKITQLSLYDNDFARLQNAVNDLEEKVSLERGKLYSESKKNVEFISDISHQLKTPISALRLYCEIDLASGNASHGEKELELIDKMENLIYKLIKLEKVKLDTYDLEFKTCKCEEIIKKIILDFKPLFPDKGFELNGEGEIRCDESWMSEAFANIIKNACEHTSEHSKIKITITQSERSTSIEIADNGGGMKQEELSKLFTRFYKAENSASSNSGIGLAISKAIVERHHGIISAENKNGGLSLTICLPKIDGYKAL